MAKRLFSWVFKLILILLITEIGVRILFRIQEKPLESSYWRMEKWILEHSGGLNNRYQIDRYDTLLGWTLNESLDSIPMGDWTVSSNSFGARGNNEYIDSTTRKIVFIGDSFTFGECVNDHETIPYYLDEFLPDYDVVNLGVHGYGNDQQLLRLKRDGMKLKPDIVVLGLIEDDFIRNSMFFRDYAKPFFEVENNRLVLKNTPVPMPDTYFGTIRWKTGSLIKATRDVFLSGMRYRQYLGFNDSVNNQRNLKIIEEMKKTAIENDAAFYIVLIPSFEQLQADRPNYHYVVNRLMKTETQFISSVDTVRQFLKNSDNPKKHTSCHFSPEINFLIAQQIQKSIH